ncbi:MAG TPA: LamG-like jellyroll fold domain-containing protein, partial [Pirellulaceae bacterium]|nr:LamG-like jellyroll fold domain-containing protein [Pirellulaceae bacterium]
MIVAGDPNGSPSDSPTNRVIPNSDISSPFAGVGSMQIQSGGSTFICTATPISVRHVISAAHCLDLDANGSIDIPPSNVDFILNYGSNISHIIESSALFVHPDWTGFDSPSVNDDVAVIELSTPLPAGVPIYGLNSDPFVSIETLTMVGHGQSGDGINGYTVGASFSVKRGGGNDADSFELDDEGSGSREVFYADFDGPTSATNFLGGLTLGNDIETTLGGGDSGGPSFIDDGTGGIEIFGINTFSFQFTPTPAPQFGSGAGGTIVSAYLDFINPIIAADTTPDQFTFDDQPDVPRSDIRTSNSIEVIGINAASPISISGNSGKYKINDGLYQDSNSTVNNGDTVTVRQTSSSSWSTAKNTTLNIGGVTDTFTVTTEAESTLPSLSINNVSKSEGNGGTTTFTFTVSMSGSNPDGASVNYATADNTATTSDGDYTAKNGTLTWPANDTGSKTISVTVNGDTNDEPNETFHVNLSGASGATISDSQGLGTIQNDDSDDPVDMRRGLVAWYPFSGNPYDESGNDNHLGLPGGSRNPTLTADRSGTPGTAYDFDEIDNPSDYLASTGPESAFDFTTATTFSAWINLDDVTQGWVLNKSSYLVPGTFGIGMSDGSVNIRVHTSDGPYHDVLSSAPIVAGEWTHVAGVYDGTGDTPGLSLYINGALDGFLSVTGTTTLYNNDERLYVGADIFNPTHKANVDGRIDDIAIYNRALNAAEILVLTTEDFKDDPPTPDLASIDNQTAMPGQTLTVPLSVMDPDTPAASLVYSVTVIGTTPLQDLDQQLNLNNPNAASGFLPYYQNYRGSQEKYLLNPNGTHPVNQW